MSVTPDIDPSPWEPETDRERLKAMLKLLEELGEGVAAGARCLMQGIDEVEPVTKKPNRLWISEELGDILANVRRVILTFQLDEVFIRAREERKFNYITRWLQGLTRPRES